MRLLRRDQREPWRRAGQSWQASLQGSVGLSGENPGHRKSAAFSEGTLVIPEPGGTARCAVAHHAAWPRKVMSRLRNGKQLGKTRFLSCAIRYS